MAARIVLPPVNPSLDANGSPLAGSTLTFYENGSTSTLQSIYASSDLSGGASLANPLTCDAAGRFPQIWCEDDASYSVKWTPFGSTPITYDDIGGIIFAPVTTNNVAFLVRKSENQSNATGNGGLATIIWDVGGEIYDRGGNFAANKFVAPVDGIYHFSGAVLIADLTTAMTSAQVQLVTDSRTFYYNAKDSAPIASGSVTIPFSIDTFMEAGDEAYINALVANGAGDTADILGDANFMYTFFAGHLVTP